jgi:hypothetical protein
MSAVVQYWNLIDWILPTVGRVNVNKCFTTPPGIEPPSVAPSSRVRLRGVILLAKAGWLGSVEAIRTPTMMMPATNRGMRFPLTFMRAY